MNVQYKWKIKDKFNHRQYIHAKNTEYREELCIQLKRFMKKKLQYFSISKVCIIIGVNSEV